MSTFLGPIVYQTIPAAWLTLQVHQLIQAALVARGWQIKAERTDAKPYTLDVIPPSSEDIGNSNAYEFVRISTADTTIGFTPYKHWNPSPQRLVINVPATSSETTLNVMGTTVTGAAGNTATQNAVLLYTALLASPHGYAWTIDYPPPQNADDTNVYLIGTCLTIKASPDTPVVSGVTLAQSIPPSSAGFDLNPDIAPATYTVTHDLTNGYVLILSICSRSLHLATRCNSGYFGAIRASYCDHAQALALMPAGLLLSPIELVVGVDGVSTALDSTVVVASNWWMGYKMNLEPSLHSGYPIPGSITNAWSWRGKIHDSVCIAYGSNRSVTSWNSLTLTGGIPESTKDNAMDDYQIFKVCSGWLSRYTSYDGSPIIPPLYPSDWWRFCGFVVDENCVFSGDPSIGNALTSTIGAGDVVIPVSDLSAYQPAGTIWINGEAIEYTGRTAASGAGNLTGALRGQYGSVAQPHAVGDVVQQCRWFLKINGSLVPTGWARAVAGA